MNNFRMSRRNFMQQSTAMAAAVAAGSTLGIRSASADRSKELNILGVYPAHAFRETFKEEKEQR